MGYVPPRPRRIDFETGRYGQADEYADPWARSSRGNAASRGTDDLLSRIDETLGSADAIRDTGKGLAGKGADFLFGASDFKNAGKALSHGHFKDAAGSAAWGALALGSTIGSAFVGPELKAAELGLQTARAARAAKMARAAKSIGVNAAVSAGASVLGNAAYQRFATPTNPSAPTESTPGPVGTGTTTGTSPRLVESSDMSVSSQFARMPRFY